MKLNKSTHEELVKITTNLTRIILLIVIVAVANFIIRLSFYSLRLNDLIFLGIALIILLAQVDEWVKKRERSKLK